MSSEIIVAIITGVFTFAGVVVTVWFGNKKTNKQIQDNADLTLYRIKELEKKVEKHNNVVERTFVLEGKVKELQHNFARYHN
jgi:uncharacterized protein YneF (UPF0154 family)